MKKNFSDEERHFHAAREAVSVFFPKDAEDVRKCHLGRDDGCKLHVRISNGREYLIKTCSENIFTIQKQAILAKYKTCNCPLRETKLYGLHIYLYPWIDGRNLAEQGVSAEDADVCAALLKKLHGESGSDYEKTLADEFTAARHKCKRSGVFIRQETFFQDYFHALLPHMTSRRPGLVHGDIKPANLMRGRDGLRLIDLEHVFFADPWMEFLPMTVLMSKKRMAFSRRLIISYFQGEIPEEFFSFCSLGAIVQLYRTAHWESRRGGNSAQAQADYLHAHIDRKSGLIHTWIFDSLKKAGNRFVAKKC